MSDSRSHLFGKGRPSAGKNTTRYWLVEIDSNAFSQFDAIYHITAPDEATARKEALDRFQMRGRNNVVSSLEMTDYAAELMSANNWSGDEGEAFAWEVVTEGWSEPATDNRWIRGVMYVDEIDLQQDFKRYCREGGYVIDRGEVYDQDWDPVTYCPHCDYICYREYCGSCGYRTYPLQERMLFDRYMKETWGE